MRTRAELAHDIIKLKTKIRLNFPDLFKVIPDMPEQILESENDSVNDLETYYESLVNLMSEYSKKHGSELIEKANDSENYADLQDYPASEDIYVKGIEDLDVDPENTAKMKKPNEIDGKENFQNNIPGNDLDVPGSELDDQQESIGSEDEENNYYSIGGDNHNDLEENDK